MVAFAFLQHCRLKKVRRKKESTDHHLNQACLPCATPSSNSSFDAASTLLALPKVDLCENAA
jgi:hypothetical protein